MLGLCFMAVISAKIVMVYFFNTLGNLFSFELSMTVSGIFYLETDIIWVICLVITFILVCIIEDWQPIVISIIHSRKWPMG